jgi:hypothetical protein
MAQDSADSEFGNVGENSFRSLEHRPLFRLLDVSAVVMAAAAADH